MRRFDGWEPEQITTYEYDDAGRLTRATTVREPEWSEQDQAWVLALAQWRAGRCPHCGGDIAECTSAEADGAYVAELPVRCHVTTALLVGQQAYRDQPHAEALLWRATRKR